MTHPIVRTHGDGRRSLYLSENVAYYIGGMAIPAVKRPRTGDLSSVYALGGGTGHDVANCGRASDTLAAWGVTAPLPPPA